jgi:hypothetical protein
MMKAKSRGSFCFVIHSPAIEPALSVERTRVVGHVRGQADVPAAKAKFAAADAVYEGHQWKTRGCQDVLKRPVAAAQYRYRLLALKSFERRNAPTD